MKINNVVYMGVVRDLLAELDKLRADVLAGEVQGWGGSVVYADGSEVVYLGGTFREDPASRARSMLRVSAVVARKDKFLPPCASVR